MDWFEGKFGIRGGMGGLIGTVRIAKIWAI